MALAHHDLCFGCGQANLFGLLLEVERVDERRVAGRCFIKQDHQGPDRRFAHQGVIAAALCEAMAFSTKEWIVSLVNGGIGRRAKSPT